MKGIISEIDIRKHMIVKDVMNSPVITINEDESVVEAAKLMDKHKLGSIIITNKNGKSLGIITERDLVVRVLAESVNPSKLLAKEVMKTPLISVKPKETIIDAAERMNKYNIRRLVVVNKGNLVGIVTSKDILAVMPELIEIIQEEKKIETINVLDESPTMTGYCGDCGEWSDTLEEVDGDYLCEECRD